jgi:hypothetical protein
MNIPPAFTTIVDTETKAQKIQRMHRELAEFRIEILTNAARILEQLDDQILSKVPCFDPEERSECIGFLNDVAATISKEKDSANLSSLS